MAGIKETLAARNEKKETIYYSTGLDLLDLCIGGGEGFGLKGGYIYNFVGDKSAGKTFLAIETLVANKHRFGKSFHPNHDDAESGCTFDTQSMYGMDLYGAKPPRKSNTVEEMDANLGCWLDEIEQDPGIYVVDSLDGLSSEDKEERADVRQALMEKGKPVEDSGSFGMGSAKFLSQEFFKTKAGAINNTKAILIIVSQVRTNLEPGLYKPKHTRSGGKALDFYAHTCLWLTTIRKIIRKVDGEERIVGAYVQAETKKSKTARPYRKVRFSLYFDYGMDNLGSNIDYLFDLRNDDGSIRETPASAIAWSGKACTFQDLLQWLKDNDAYDTAKEFKRAETGKAALSQEWVSSYIQKVPALKEKLEEDYGVTMTRDQIIAMCENDPEKAAELTARVRAKWEGIEESMLSNRKPKYA